MGQYMIREYEEALWHFLISSGVKGSIAELAPVLARLTGRLHLPQEPTYARCTYQYLQCGLFSLKLGQVPKIILSITS